METLLDEFTAEFVILTATCMNDGEGGQKTVYSESSPFLAVIRHNRTQPATKAEQESTVSSYTIVTRKSVILNFHMIVKRVSDDACFRITSDCSNVPPSFSSIDMRSASAEKIILPE